MLSAICGLTPVAVALTLSLLGGVLCHTHEKGVYHFNTLVVRWTVQIYVTLVIYLQICYCSWTPNVYSPFRDPTFWNPCYDWRKVDWKYFFKNMQLFLRNPMFTGVVERKKNSFFSKKSLETLGSRENIDYLYGSMFWKPRPARNPLLEGSHKTQWKVQKSARGIATKSVG